MSDIVIQFKNVSKSYNIRQRGYGSLREEISRSLKSLLSGRHAIQNSKFKIQNCSTSSPSSILWALKDVSFSVKRGEAVGIIGANGSGKTTTLRLLSRVTAPTEGSIDILGRVAPLIQVGAGFHPELTGRENVYLNATIMGLAKKDIDKKYDDIVSFAELDGFMDTPVKRYSSGMYVRLGFAVVANIDPDIFLIDEILSVGDLNFQRKCLDTMGRIRKSNKSIVFVSHNISAVRGLCDRVIWLNKGVIEQEGDPDDVINAYVSYMTSKSTFINDTSYVGGKTRWGTGEVRFTAVEVLNSEGVRSNRFQPGDKIVVKLEYEADKKIYSPTFWVGLMNKDEIKVFGTYYNKNRVGEYSIDNRGSLSCVIDSLPMRPGVYYVMAGIYGEFGDLAIDRIGRAAEFEIEPMNGNDYDNYNGYGADGAVNLSHQWNNFDNI
ncbi:MAG: ABC transporter ATP-binding protein [Proteobacteria bacterium]|nr:ABC transporter ATP-binding protein [Pseudomonadota bacterium]